MVPETIFKCCFTWAKVRFLFISSDVRVSSSAIRRILPSIESRLSTLSFKEKIFQEPVLPYQKALHNFGYRHTLTCKRPKNDNKSTSINKIKRNRKRQIIWFDPPFNINTETKIGKLFLNLLDKHFPPDNKLHKLFSQINVKNQLQLYGQYELLHLYA